MDPVIPSAKYYATFERVVPPCEMSSFAWVAFANAWIRTYASKNSGVNRKLLYRIAKLGVDLNNVGLGKEKASQLSRILSQSESIVLNLQEKGIREPWPDWSGLATRDEYCAHMARSVANVIAVQSRHMINKENIDVGLEQIDETFNDLASSALLIVSYAACIDSRHAKFGPIIKEQSRILDDGFRGQFGPAVQDSKLKKLDQITKNLFNDSVDVLSFDGIIFDKKFLVASCCVLTFGILGTLQLGLISLLSASLFIASVCTSTALYLVHRAHLLGLRSKILFHLCGALVFVEGVYLAANLIFREWLG